jgi:hypothetical protein
MGWTMPRRRDSPLQTLRRHPAPPGRLADAGFARRWAWRTATGGFSDAEETASNRLGSGSRLGSGGRVDRRRKNLFKNG